MKSFFLMYLMRGHSFRVYAKFPKKLTFLTLWYAHIRKFCVRTKLMTPVNNAEAYFLTLSNIHDEAFWEAVFFQSLFLSQTLAIHWKEGKGRGYLYSSLPHSSTHKHSDIYLQLCIWDDYSVFSITVHAITRLTVARCDFPTSGN